MVHGLNLGLHCDHAFCVGIATGKFLSTDILVNILRTYASPLYVCLQSTISFERVLIGKVCLVSMTRRWWEVGYCYISKGYKVHSKHWTEILK